MSNVKRFLSIAVRYSEHVNNLLVIISCLCIVALMFITVYHVVMRYFFHSPTTWFFELAEYAMVFIIFLPLAYTQQLKQHITVDVLTTRISKKMLTRIEVAVSALSLFFWIFFTWSAVRYFNRVLEEGRRSYEGLDWPQWVIVVVIPISGFLLSSQLVIQFIRYIAEVFTKQEDSN